MGSLRTKLTERWRVLAGVLIGACLAGALYGCTTPRPDLAHIYADRADAPKEHPVIVIPGVMGSRLFDADSGREVWPGSVLNLLTGWMFDDLALPLAAGTHWEPGPSLVPGDLFYDIAGQDFYDKLVRTLNGPGGYDCVAVEEVGADTDCVLFSWDWRRDLVKAAARLDTLIDRLARLRGDPDLRVDIVGHSAGGLVTRYFLRYGGADVLEADGYEITNAGARRVRKAVLIGTPNFGSISALQQAIRGLRVGSRRIAPEIIATMPGLYQLLPHPERTWMVDLQSNRIERDLYDPDTWREWQWTVFDPDVRQRLMNRFDSRDEGRRYLEQLESAFAQNLRRGEQFQLALTNLQHQPPNEYVVFGGDCYLTPARCLLETVNGRPEVRLRPEEIANPLPGVDYTSLMLEPGDGTVTKSSLLGRDVFDATKRMGGLFPIDYSVFLCEKHFRLAGNTTFRDNLLNILLY